MKKRLIRLTGIILALALLLSISGCSAQKALSDEKAAELTQQVIEEFKAIAQVPRPSGYTEKIRAYVIQWAEKNGFKYDTDQTGNVWMDIPATQGNENMPKIVLQGHMDMVCVAEEGKNIDFQQTGITPVVKDHKMIAEGTSLGADDGIGMATMMAIAKNDAVHGPLRLIFTVDEETTMAGVKALSSEVLDGDYLINLDNEKEGQLCYSSAGAVGCIFSKTCTLSPSLAGCFSVKTEISGLLGGHSGLDVNKGRLSAVKALSYLLKQVEDAGISYQLSDFSSGKIKNAIANEGSFTLVVSENQIEQVNKIISTGVVKLKEKYPEENIESNILMTDMEKAGEVSVVSPEDSKSFVHLLEGIKQDVITLSEKTKDFPQTSNNIGMSTLKEGVMTVACFSRSCVTDDLNGIIEESKTLAKNNGFELTTTDMMPGYDGDPNSNLVKIFQKGYQTAGVKAKAEAVHAGFEMGYFQPKKPALTMISVGPTITDVHTTNETLELDTIEPMLQALYYTFQHAEELKK